MRPAAQVDIHPAATIGNGVMLDHASGIVIGSTAIVGSDVYMLHGVTLGATGRPTGGKKRHPTVGSRVVRDRHRALPSDRFPATAAVALHPHRSPQHSPPGAWCRLHCAW